MNTYPKIQGLYHRDMDKNSSNYGKFIIGKYSKPEFELLKDITWIFTEKIDGTNIRVQIYNDAKIEFKGRTDKAQMPNHLLLKLQELFTKEKINSVFELSENRPDICLYGEGYGYKIQKGGKYFPENPKEVGFILFDIKIGNIWLKREDIEKITDQLGIEIVPIVGSGTIDTAIKMVKAGFRSTFGDFIAEGLVIHPIYELLDRRAHRIITKIKYSDWRKNK